MTHDPHGSAISELAQQLGRHARLAHLVKERATAGGTHGLDWGSLLVLLLLTKRGPSRQAEIADLALLDRSTISRHVAQLVKAGLLTRRADPHDGRAVHLVATEAGERVGREISTRRCEVLASALTTWPETRIVDLADLLTQLNESLETFLFPPRSEPPPEQGTTPSDTPANQETS